MAPTLNYCKEGQGSALLPSMRNKVDAIEFGSRVRQGLAEENTGLRQWRRSRLEWRALQALMDATISAAA
ncbi:MAG TPA: hypothetical protein VFB78_10795 [Acidimicrobiales bacterium]|nr:hypothetical protein [Acidimicrobiales bacterium]